MSKPGRNDPCPCGSGRKYKHCCGAATVAPGPSPAAPAKLDAPTTLATHATRSTGVLDTLQRASIHHQAGRLAQAHALYDEILAVDPLQPDALCLMGALAAQVGQHDAALRLLRQAVAADPEHVEAHYNLGRVLFDRGDLEAAGEALETAVRLRPGDARAHGNLASARESQGRLDAAIHHFRLVVALQPDDAAGHGNLANVLQADGQSAEALTSFAAALALQPDNPATLRNLGLALSDQGRFTEAAATFRRALSLRPDDAATFSTLLFTLLYDRTMSTAELAAEHERYVQTFEPALRAAWQPHANLADPERRLRVGYVSFDLRRHPVGQLLEPLLRRHDRAAFEVHAYHTHPRRDAVTERLATYVEHWHDVHAHDDAQLADAVRADGIDILVDLSGHSLGNRLLAFARKPAPVQISWLGYPFMTGLAAIDHRVTDRVAEPPSTTRDAVWYLPGTGQCYQPPDNGPLPLDHLPLDDAGAITFGCFNNFAKVNDGVLAAWSRILQRLPTARLLLEINGLGRSSYRELVRARLETVGLPMDRVILEPRSPSNQYVLYRRVDIALDPFPYNGGTTTFDALWMGVPVVTLAGDRLTSRIGISILTYAGLAECVAQTADAYVDLAVALAGDESRLRALRQGLRERLSTSPPFDGAAFARGWEEALREMWVRWCADHGGDVAVRRP